MNISYFVKINASIRLLMTYWYQSCCLLGYIGRNHQRHSTDQLEHDGICVFQHIRSSELGDCSHREWISQQWPGIPAWTFYDQRSTIRFISGYHRLGQRSSFREWSQSRQILAVGWPTNHSLCPSSLSSYRCKRVDSIGARIRISDEKDEISICTEFGLKKSKKVIRCLQNLDN